MPKNGHLRISDLIPDDRNANKGTERGNGLLERSLQQYGAGRSILIDKNNRIIAGNKTVEIPQLLPPAGKARCFLLTRLTGLTMKRCAMVQR